MNKSDLEKMQKCQEEYEKFLKESPLHSEMERIAEDIIKRRNIDMAMEFARTIAELLRENGIVAHCQEYQRTEDISEKSIKTVYGVIFDSVDCTEHDRKFTDRIAELEEKDIKKQEKIQDLAGVNMQLQVERNELRQKVENLQEQISKLESELSVKENLLKIKDGLCGEKSDYEKLMEELLSYEPTNKEDDIAQSNYYCLRTWANSSKREKRISELEGRHQSDCITINQLHTALDVMTEKYQKLREIHGL